MRIIGNLRLLYESKLDFRIIYAIFCHINEWQAIFLQILTILKFCIFIDKKNIS